MQKRMLLALVFLSSFGVHAMEAEAASFIVAGFTYLSTLLTSSAVPLSPMQKVQVDKSEFEYQLQIGWHLRTLIPLVSGYFRDRVKINPAVFPRYCYIQKFHRELDACFKLSDLDQDAILLNECKEARINGYSALGAAILAKDVDIEYKKDFINQLMDKGFTFTENDKALIALELYNAIPAEEKQMMLFLLHDHQEGGLTLLPHEVKRYIVDCALCLYKEKE